MDWTIGYTPLILIVQRDSCILLFWKQDVEVDGLWVNNLVNHRSHVGSKEVQHGNLCSHLRHQQEAGKELGHSQHVALLN